MLVEVWGIFPKPHVHGERETSFANSKSLVQLPGLAHQSWYDKSLDLHDINVSIFVFCKYFERSHMLMLVHVLAHRNKHLLTLSS